MPEKKKSAYGNRSISALKGADRVRLRPGVIFGSDGLEGCAHGVFEILSNSTDEAKAGYGTMIETTRFKDGSIQVRDHGRGVPLDYNDVEKRYNWDLIYCELYAGGKYDADGDNYKYSLGLNGLGACATQYASEYFDVTSVRDGFEYKVHFEKGKNIGGLKKEPTKSTDTGTTQRWKPDKDVFTDTNIPLEMFQEMLKRQAIINAGITYILDDEESGQHFEYFYPEGILGYIKEVDGDKGFTLPVIFEAEGEGKDRIDKTEYKVKVSVAFCFNNQKNLLEYFHNSSWLEHGGSPDKAVRSAFVSAFDKEIKARNKYSKNENKINFSDIQDSLILITNSFSTQTSYENQTKKAINNKFIQDFMTDMIKENLAIWFIENKIDGDKAIEQILINKRSRESSEAQRVSVKKKLMGTIDVTNRVQKFVDCREKDPNKRELFIVEGDSALGSVKLGRDAKMQAIMPIRGKILNCLKSDINSIFKSDIITDLIRVLGCGVEVKTKNTAKDLIGFKLENLKYKKIIILSDADVDGYHIRCLVITMLYRLCPQLIEKGYVYIGETPLFEITYKNRGKEQTFFAYTDAERDAIKKGKDPSKLKIQRSKGLGENTPEMMWETSMNPETRRLIRVNSEDAETMSKYFELFLGNDIGPRKQYIEENGHIYLDDLDLD